MNLKQLTEPLLPTDVCAQVLRGVVADINAGKLNGQHTLYSVFQVLQTLQHREDLSLEELASIEYQYLPILEQQGEPVALPALLRSSPEFFVSVICDVFLPASKENRKEASEEQRIKARFGYRMLQSMKSLPGFTEEAQDIDFLKNWVVRTRSLAREADRKAIADQQIGQVLAYAPVDAVDNAWPVRGVREVIEEVASDDIEQGIQISRFNMRGVFCKAMYEGGGKRDYLRLSIMLGQMPVHSGLGQARCCDAVRGVGNVPLSRLTFKLNSISVAIPDRLKTVSPINDQRTLHDCSLRIVDRLALVPNH